jgi:cytochrome P450
LVNEPELLLTATEEFLRYFSPVKGNARTAMKDVTVGGCPVRAGDRLHVGWASANRDESQFPKADDFDPHRFPNRHVAFGMGPHRCLGSHLARAMFAEMLTQILVRMPDYKVRTSDLASFPSSAAIGGWSSVPASFTPGRRSA